MQRNNFFRPQPAPGPGGRRALRGHAHPGCMGKALSAGGTLSGCFRLRPGDRAGTPRGQRFFRRFSGAHAPALTPPEERTFAEPSQKAAVAAASSGIAGPEARLKGSHLFPQRAQTELEPCQPQERPGQPNSTWVAAGTAGASAHQPIHGLRRASEFAPLRSERTAPESLSVRQPGFPACGKNRPGGSIPGRWRPSPPRGRQGPERD